MNVKTIFFLFLLSIGFSKAAHAYEAKDVVSWKDLSSFVSVGQCWLAPDAVRMNECSPARLGRSATPRVSGSAFVSASELVLDAAQSAQKKQVDTAKINTLLKAYDAAEFLLQASVIIDTKYVSVGVYPKRYTGQFFLHNPNLPFASVVFRDDSELYVAHGTQLQFEGIHIGLGVKLNGVMRTETMGEASIAEVAARAFKELNDKQKKTGGFADVAAKVEVQEIFSVGLTLNDIGDWNDAEERALNSLYIERDKAPRLTFGAAFLPRFLYGDWQVGAELISKLDGLEKNTPEEQWFGTVSYFNGPLSVLSGFNQRLLRTALKVEFDKYNIALAQQWYDNRDELARRPRLLTLEMGAHL